MKTKNNQHDDQFAALDYDAIAAAQTPPAEADAPRASAAKEQRLRPDSPLIQSDSVVTVYERRAQWDEYLSHMVPRASVAQVGAVQAMPVAWRHSLTGGLYEQECDVPLADGDESVEPLYLDATAKVLRAAVEAMVSMCEEGEWAEHVASTTGRGDPLAQRLEDVLTELHNEVNVDGHPAPADPVQGVAMQQLVECHAAELERNPYAYFELAYTRRTEWMAWICSRRIDDDPNRKVIARGQGSTPEEACQRAIESLAPVSADTPADEGKTS